MVKTCSIIILPHKKQLKAKEGENLFRFLSGGVIPYQVLVEGWEPAGSVESFSQKGLEHLLNQSECT